jgi:serine/threonine protein kinase
MQGGLEFKTEIELLSRVHHKNVVSLIGFCFDRGEQMLVYEFVPNGSLMESLSGTFIGTYELSMLRFDTWNLLPYNLFFMKI